MINFQFSGLFAKISLSLSLIVAESQLLAQEAIKELELIDIIQLSKDYKNRFDLSGITEKDSKIFVVADKGWNNYIYEIAIDSGVWNIKSAITLGLIEHIDLEGIDQCGEDFYFINEKDSKVFKLDNKGFLHTLFVHFEGKNISPQKWQENTGLESIAVNCKESLLYLAKERDPRFILEIDLQIGVIREKFSIPDDKSNDFSDMKYQDGFLYLLERNGNYIAKFDLHKREIAGRLSYKNVCSSPKGKLYEPSEYGMAEALLLTENEIWIGIDNNGLSVSKHAEKIYGLRGNQPSILRFKRPENF